MYCNQCGAPLATGAEFCGQCGKATGAPAGAAAGAPVYVPPAAGRVERHRTILAVLWLVLGLLGLIGGWALLAIAQARPWDYSPGAGHVPPFLAPLLSGIAMVLLLFSALRVIAAVGLFAVQNWARVLLIVLAIISLIEIPIGTALGIYTLWVMMPRESEAEFEGLARARAAGQQI